MISFSEAAEPLREDGRDYTMSFELEYAATMAKHGKPELKIRLPRDEVELSYIESPGQPLEKQSQQNGGNKRYAAKLRWRRECHVCRWRRLGRCELTHS